MYRYILAPVAVVLAVAAVVTEPPPRSCKCGPNDKCWPSDLAWSTFKLVLGNRLMKSEPIARSCYQGPAFNRAECDAVTDQWTDQDFMTSIPIGRPYPYNISCPPVDYGAGAIPGTCELGISPKYVVNASSRYHIRSALLFARLSNIRLVVASTGHDLLGRSDGYGSLEIWLRHFHNRIDFQRRYTSANRCDGSGWTGSAIHIDGAWQWRDVYEVAKANNVIVAGGGSFTPGAIGGWPAGGGHGPASRNYGLGADQILEAEVLLASGRTVVANHCENPDLFRSLRGGGPGYGIVLSTTVKAYPNVDIITAHHLAIAPLSQAGENKNNSDLLDAVSLLLQSLPDLNDAGFAGYGSWFRNYPAVYVNNATSGYKHGMWTIGLDRAAAEAGFAPVRQKLLSRFGGVLSIVESWHTYTDYWAFYAAESGVYEATGETAILTSRLIDRAAVSDPARVRDAVETLSGSMYQVVANAILLVSGGAVFSPDPSSGLHPAWRSSHFALVTGQGVPREAGADLRRRVAAEVTHVRGAAARRLAPNTGAYMNEGDRNDPLHLEAFYGEHYEGHLRVKRKYDPSAVFYCPTCVGSEEWVERPDGPLCRK